MVTGVAAGAASVRPEQGWNWLRGRLVEQVGLGISKFSYMVGRDTLTLKFGEDHEVALENLAVSGLDRSAGVQRYRPRPIIQS